MGARCQYDYQTTISSTIDSTVHPTVHPIVKLTIQGSITTAQAPPARAYPPGPRTPLHLAQPLGPDDAGCQRPRCVRRMV